jgi:hypothetical protein
MAENHHPDLKPPEPRFLRVSVAASLFLLALTILFYWKLTLTNQYTWFDHPDMAYLELPRLQFQAREIQQGNFPLWDPHIWTGQSLIGQTQPGPLFPLNLLFYQLKMRDGYLRFNHLNYYWVAIHFLAAWFFYCLARDLNLSQSASLISGCLFGYGGFVGSVAWLDVVNGAIWAPLVLLFLSRSTRGIRPLTNAALGGLFLGVAWLSGHHELPILISLMAAGCWLYFIVQRPVRIGAGVLFFVVAMLIASTQALATFEFGRLSMRWIGLENTVTWKDKIPYTVQTIYSLPPQGLLATFLPGFGTYADSSPFLGVIGIAMALFGLVACWKEQTVRLAGAIAAISTVYSMGVFAPLNGVMYALLPVVDKARIPSRAVLIVGFALTVLAAYGLDFLLRARLAAETRKLRIALIVAGSLITGSGIVFIMQGANVNDRNVLAGVVCLVAALLLYVWQAQMLSRAVLVTGLLSLSLVELTNGGPSRYANRFEKDSNKFLSALTQYRDVAEFLKSEKQPVRVNVDDSLIGANFGDWHGIDMLQGYVAGLPLTIMLHEHHTARTQSIFSVTHYVGQKPQFPDQVEVFKSRDGVNVYRSANALPRVRTVHETKSVPDEAWMRVNVQDVTNDLARTVMFIGEAPKLETCTGTDLVQTRVRTTDRVVFDVNMACRGLLVVSESMYPGWVATVDASPARIWNAYGTFRSVVVDAGRHSVEMPFRPRTVYYGAALGLLGLVLVAAVAISRR